MNNIAKDLNLMIKELGFTQIEFARYCGICQSTISSYCRGKRIPGMNNLLKLIAIAKKHNFIFEWTPR